MPDQPGEAPDRSNARLAVLIGLGGLAVAFIGVLGLSDAEPPYLGFDGIEPWAVIYLAGLFAALGAIPFALHARAVQRVDDVDRHWELALSQWGGVCLLAGVGFVLIGAGGSFDTDTVSGAVAVGGLAEVGMVVVALLVLLLTTG